MPVNLNEDVFWEHRQRCSQFFDAFGYPETNTCDCAARNLRQNEHMKRFEYDVVYMKTEVSDASSQGTISHQVRKVLNAMGKDGWELVSVAQDQVQVRLFLKRELLNAKA